MTISGNDTQSRILFDSVADRVQRQSADDRVEANQAVTNRVQMQSVSNRVQAKPSASGRLDIGA